MAEACDRFADEGDAERELLDDDLRVDVKRFTTEAAEAPVPAGVSSATEAMVRAVDFDDEPEGWREEVGDGVAEDDGGERGVAVAPSREARTRAAREALLDLPAQLDAPESRV